MHDIYKVYIVVLNWNGWRDTIECLSSLMNLKYKKFTVVVCDNASADESEDEIKKWIKSHESLNIMYIQTGANLGFAGGNNVGIRYALSQEDCDYIWFLNNDTVVDPMALSNLLMFMKANKQIGICGSTLMNYYDNSVLQGYGGRFNHILGYAYTVKNICDICKMDYPIGASMLVSREFILDVGLMCEDYFLYYEELDWSIRGRRKGYMVSCAVDSIVYHKEGASIGSHANLSSKSIMSDYYIQRNKLWIIKKFYPRNVITVRTGMLIGVMRRLLHSEFAKAFQQLEITLKG